MSLRLAIAPMLAAACLLLPSCVARPDPNSLRVVFWAGLDEQRIEEANIAAFEASHPGVTVSLESIPDSYLEKLVTAFASGKPPDVLLLDSVLIPRFLEGDVLLDLAPYLNAPGVNDLSEFYPEVLAIAQREGSDGTSQLYALPKDFTPLVVYYNRRLFDAAGVEYPAAGWSWQDFRDKASALCADTDSDGKRDPYGTLIYTTPIFNVVWFWQAGGDVLAPDGLSATGYLDSPAAIEAAQFFTGLIADGIAPDPTAREALGGQAFMSGKVAMTISGHWSIPGFRRASADAQSGKSGAAAALGLEDIGVAPLPAGRQRANVVYESGWAVAKDSHNPQLAVELARYLSGEEAQRRRAAMGLAVSANRRVAEETAAADPRELVFLGEVAVARAPWGTRIADWSVVEKLLEEATERIILGRASAEQSLKDSAGLIDSELRDY